IAFVTLMGFSTPALAQASPQENPFTAFIPLIIVLVIFFIMRKRKKEETLKLEKRLVNIETRLNKIESD
ncbi:MAG: hypothetical protein VCC36_10990, partial [Gammaproteobacteria bacterium]